jgi:hypothetical protein
MFIAAFPDRGEKFAILQLDAVHRNSYSGYIGRAVLASESYANSVWLATIRNDSIGPLIGAIRATCRSAPADRDAAASAKAPPGIHSMRSLLFMPPPLNRLCRCY